MNKFKARLNELIPDLSGSLITTDIRNVLTVKGVLVSSQPKDEVIKAVRQVASEEYPNMMLALDVQVNSGLTVLSNEGSVTDIDHNHPLDEIGVLYQGMLDVNAITMNSKHKIMNENAREVLDNIYRVLEFTVPVILDSNLKVIDGNLRLDIAINNGATEVPVIILDAADERAEFLRLSINRATEFQRWNYEEVDDFVDSIPQVQPLLEPLGFFGKKILPVSFFANTVVNYELDPYNEQQQKYRQEIGIAEWAKIQRERHERIEREKQERLAKKADKAKSTSLFDMIPKEEDFLETHDIHDEIEKHQVKMRDVANTITVNYDEKRKREIEERGGVWQNTRRTSTEKAADLRAEAEAEENVDEQEE